MGKPNKPQPDSGAQRDPKDRQDTRDKLMEKAKNEGLIKDDKKKK